MRKSVKYINIKLNLHPTIEIFRTVKCNPTRFSIHNTLGPSRPHLNSYPASPSHFKLAYLILDSYNNKAEDRIV